MPDPSSDVNAGDQALAAQYNNLRDLALRVWVSKEATPITISSGVASIASKYSGLYLIAAESGVTDDLDDISGGETGEVIWIMADTGDTITVKHASGKILLTGDKDTELSGNTAIQLRYNGTDWYQLGGSAGGGQARKSLPINAAYLPDDSSGSEAAQIQHRISSDATDPQLFWVEALFDDTQDEYIYFAFLMPDNYNSDPVVDVYYKMASDVANDVEFGAAMACVSDGDSQDLDAHELDTMNYSGAVAVPGTAGYMDVASITMTNNDSVAAGDWVILCICRHPEGGNDDAVGDAEVVLCVLRYTST
jgi:hypothetical protein